MKTQMLPGWRNALWTAAVMLCGVAAAPAAESTMKAGGPVPPALRVIAVEGSASDLKLDHPPVATVFTRAQLAAPPSGAGGPVMVFVECVVGADGAVSEVSARNGTDADAAAAAVKAVAGWTFKPAVKAGRAVGTRVVTLIVFRAGPS